MIVDTEIIEINRNNDENSSYVIDICAAIKHLTWHTVIWLYWETVYTAILNFLNCDHIHLLKSVSACLLLFGWVSEGVWGRCGLRLNNLFRGTLTSQLWVGPEWTARKKKQHPNTMNHIFKIRVQSILAVFIVRYYHAYKLLSSQSNSHCLFSG